MRRWLNFIAELILLWVALFFWQFAACVLDSYALFNDDSLPEVAEWYVTAAQLYAPYFIGTVLSVILFVQTRRSPQAMRSTVHFALITLLLLQSLSFGCALLIHTDLRNGHRPRWGKVDRPRAIHNQELVRDFVYALKQFTNDCGRFPTQTEGLSALSLDPDIEGWRGPYISTSPNDVWGQPLYYKVCEARVDLFSAGADGKLRSDDDQGVNLLR